MYREVWCCSIIEQNESVWVNREVDVKGGCGVLVVFLLGGRIKSFG
jgi:hypothetical protein